MSNIFYDISGDDPTDNSGNGWAEYSYGTNYSSWPNSSSQSYDGWNVLLNNYLREWAKACTNTQLGAVTPGSGYTDGNYTNVFLISEQQFNEPSVQCGEGLRVNVTVAGGAVTQVTMTTGGQGYQTNEYVVLADGDTSLGAGTGFKVQVASANSDVIIARDLWATSVWSSTSTNYVGWLILFNREDDGFHSGYFLYWAGNRGYRLYARVAHSFNAQSDNNNGYGDFVFSFATRMGYTFVPSGWGEDGEASKRFYVSYSTTPGEEYFSFTMAPAPGASTTDQMDEYALTIGKLTQPSGPDYPSAQTMPPWFLRYWEATSSSGPISLPGPWAVGCTQSRANITDLINQWMPCSADQGNMLTGLPIFSDAFFLGYTTPALGYSSAFSYNDQYIQADDTVWTKRGQTLWIKGPYEWRGNAAPPQP